HHRVVGKDVEPRHEIGRRNRGRRRFWSVLERQLARRRLCRGKSRQRSRAGDERRASEREKLGTNQSHELLRVGFIGDRERYAATCVNRSVGSLVTPRAMGAGGPAAQVLQKPYPITRRNLRDSLMKSSGIPNPQNNRRSIASARPEEGKRSLSQ